MTFTVAILPEVLQRESFENFQRRHSALAIPTCPDPSQDLLRNLWSALSTLVRPVSSFKMSFSPYYTVLRLLMNFNQQSVLSRVSLLVDLLAYCMIT